MEALRYNSKSKKIQLLQVSVPKITEPSDVLIKVAYSGVCGSDIHIVEGYFPLEENEWTMGHEFSGIVVDVGDQVKTLKIGDKVAVDPITGCNCCNYCHSGNPHFCTIKGLKTAIGIARDGGWAKYVVVPVEHVNKVPECLSLEQAVLAEPLSCLSHCWDLIHPISLGSKILVVGAGIIGNLLVCMLHLQGHKKVTVSDSVTKRLEILERLKTGYTLVTPDTLKNNQSQDSEYLFDVIVECSGNVLATEQAFGLLQFGGKLCIFGVTSHDSKISISPFDITQKELKIIGVKLNPLSFPKSINLLESMGERYLNYDNLGIKMYALKDYKVAMEDLKNRCISKAVFKM